MALFPPETSFFINSWTWGYEDILRAIAFHFQSQIHVDRYKHSVYSHIADPYMRSLITLDASKTRFHACERFNRCPHASADDVVYINPVTIGKVKWEQYCHLTESKLRSAQPVTVLVRSCPFITRPFSCSHTSKLVPLSRHSPLNELRAFVSLFRPARVVPNTLDPSLHGLDALSIPNIFTGCLSNSQTSTSSAAFGEALVSDDIEIIEDGGDSALQNLIGGDAERIARAWADSGRGAEKLAIVEQFLTGPACDTARRALGLAPLPRESNNNNNNGIECAVSILQRIRDKQRIQVCRRGAQCNVVESDQETESQDSDAHVRMAKMLFGLEAGTTDSQCEKESREEGPGTVPASRVPTPPPVSECGSRLSVTRGSSRHVTRLDFSNLQGRRSLRTEDMMGNARAVSFADSEPGLSPPTRIITHASSPPSLTSPIRSSSPVHRGDPPPVGLKHTPLTRTKRQHPLSQSFSSSQSQSQSQSPPTIHLNALKPSMKRRKLERLTTVPAHEDAPASPRKQVAPGGAENVTPAGLNANPTVLVVDAENRKTHRSVLRARSRVIEEKLRRALLAPSSTPPEKVS
jgi:hypothetical protein